MHTDQFTAVGPPFKGSGVKNTGFSTKPMSAATLAIFNAWRRLFRQPAITEVNFEYGVNAQGLRCGVYGGNPNIDAERDSTMDGVGVHGIGENFGVFGNGTPGTAGIFGEHTRGGVGVIGATMRSGTGVIGASLQNIGNPLETFQSIPDPGDGDGDGVFGISGLGTGVRGTSSRGNGGSFTSVMGDGIFGESKEGAGVVGKSDRGPGVIATSTADRGGVFESGPKVAQINLVPRDQAGNRPQLPKDDRVGDLLLIRNRRQVEVGLDVISEHCSLWLCTSVSHIAGADWREIMLGRTVKGTL
jgi:hypothetical protein